MLATADVRALVHQADVDMQVIGGKHDAVTTVADAQWLAQNLPRASLAVLPGAHIANIEATAEFNRLLRPA